MAHKKVEDYHKDGYFMRLTGTIFHPLTFFAELKEEKGLERPFRFYLYSALIASLISFLFLVNISESPLAAFFVSVIAMLADLLFLFVIAGVFYIFIRILHGPHDFYQTFKAFAYMAGFWILTAFISGASYYYPVLSILNLFIAIWALILWGSCLKHFIAMAHWKIAVAMLLTVFVFVVTLYCLLLLGGQSGVLGLSFAGAA